MSNEESRADYLVRRKIEMNNRKYDLVRALEEINRINNEAMTVKELQQRLTAVIERVLNGKV